MLWLILDFNKRIWERWAFSYNGPEIFHGSWGPSVLPPTEMCNSIWKNRKRNIRSQKMDTYWARMIHKPRGPIVLVRVYSFESSEKSVHGRRFRQMHTQKLYKRKETFWQLHSHEIINNEKNKKLWDWKRSSIAESVWWIAVVKYCNANSKLLRFGFV